MLAFLGFALFYLAALNGTLSLGLENCTGSIADDLLAGPIISLILYFGGLICLVIARPPRTAYIAASPILFLVAWQFKFTVELAYGYVIQGRSACAVLHDLPYEFDGREATFIGLWLAMCLIPLIGLLLAFRRAKPRSLPH